jgi:hypothetical protein
MSGQIPRHLAMSAAVLWVWALLLRWTLQTIRLMHTGITSWRAARLLLMAMAEELLQLV